MGLIKMPLGGKNYVIETNDSEFTAKEIYVSKNKDGNDQERENIMGYYSSLGNAVHKIIQTSLASKKEALTIMEYVDSYNDLRDIIYNIIPNQEDKELI